METSSTYTQVADAVNNNNVGSRIWNPGALESHSLRLSRILHPFPYLFQPSLHEQSDSNINSGPDHYLPSTCNQTIPTRYSRAELLALRPTLANHHHANNTHESSSSTTSSSLLPEVKFRLRGLGILKHYRGCRGGTHIRKKIPVRITNCVQYQNPVPASVFRPKSLISVPLIHEAADAKNIPRKPAILSLPTVFMTNAQSLVNKFEDISAVFELNCVDIAVITESWFTSNIPTHQLDIDNYTLFSKSREQKRGGGVAVYVRNELPSSNIPDIVVPDQLECKWVMVRPKRLPRGISALAVCAVYIITDSPHQELLADHLLNSIDILREKYPDIGIIISGDFNRMNIQPITRGNDLFQIINFPTRGDATLDFIITNSKLKELYSDPIPYSPIGYSDHRCVLWKSVIADVSYKNVVKTHFCRPITDSGIRSFGTWLQNQDWHEVLNAQGTQNKTNVFYQILDCANDLFFPVKKKKVHNNDKPWVTSHIKNLIIARQRAFENDDKEWRKLRNRVKREIIKAKSSYHVNRIRMLQKTEPRKWHQQIKNVTNNRKSELRIDIPGIDEDDHVGKANAINNMFTNVSAHIDPLDMSKLPTYLPAETPAPQLNPWEVYSELKKVKASKATGPDGVKPQLVKEFAYELSIPLTDILNSSYVEGVVPTQWKKAHVVPIPKTNPPNIEKLRPVSLTSIFAKIAEGFVCKWILDDIHYLIDTRQYGNVPGISTNHYLLNLTHFLHQGAEKRHNVGTVVLTDFSKAFDLINHTLLIEKMIEMGVNRAIVPWICDFLHNRQQCVKLNGFFSDFMRLMGGVPQGTKFGPLGFQVIINDAADNAKSKCLKYVDDLTFVENRNFREKGHLQNDLDEFKDWSENNCLTLNPTKCQALQVQFGKQSPLFTDLRIGNEPLMYVDKAKVLGLWLQNNLKWDAQVNDILTKANRRLFMLRTLKKFNFDQDELTVVYKSYVRPTLEYADVIWHSGITSKQTNDIEKIQKRACRTILGHKYFSYDDALTSCNLVPLNDRRYQHCVKFSQGLNKNNRTSTILPPTRIEAHGRNLRNSNQISQLPVRTARFAGSPVPYFVNILNNL